MKSLLQRVKYPIIQAPMAGQVDSAMTVACCNAGVLGSLPCGMLSPEEALRHGKRIKAETSAPFHMNFFVFEETDEDPQKDAKMTAWIRKLEAAYAKLSCEARDSGAPCSSAKPASPPPPPPSSSSPSPSRKPFSLQHLEVIEELRPALVSFHFGLPRDEALLERLRTSSSGYAPLVACSATTVEEIEYLKSSKHCDVIIVQGVEAGGHRGTFLPDADPARHQLGTFELLKAATASSSRTPPSHGKGNASGGGISSTSAAANERMKKPLVASGGIRTPEDVRRALDMGASMVQIGTPFLLAKEALTAPLYRYALCNSRAPAVVTNVMTGKPARMLRNEWIAGFEEGAGASSGWVMAPPSVVPKYPTPSAAIAPFKNRCEKEMCAVDFTPVFAGSGFRTTLDAMVKYHNRKRRERGDKEKIDDGRISASDVVEYFSSALSPSSM